MNIPAQASKDMDEIKQFIRDVGDELASKIQTSKMEEIAKKHLHDGVKDILGVDSEIAGEVRDLRANLSFVRSFRKASEKIGMTMLLTLATVMTAGIAALIWRSMGR